MEDVPAMQDSALLDLVPSSYNMPGGDNESSNEYSEETDTCHPLVELLEKFLQLQDQFAYLKSAAYQPTYTAELTQLSENCNTSLWCSNDTKLPSLMWNLCTKLCMDRWTPCVPHTDKQTSL